MSLKTKDYSLWAKATDKNGKPHYVTISGRFTQERITDVVPSDVTVRDENGKEHVGIQLLEYHPNVRKFVMARAICDPRDTFDVEVGKQIANRRIDKGEIIGSVESKDVTMLNADMCNLLLINELKFTIDNLDKFLPQN